MWACKKCQVAHPAVLPKEMECEGNVTKQTIIHCIDPLMRLVIVEFQRVEKVTGYLTFLTSQMIKHLKKCVETITLEEARAI